MSKVVKMARRIGIRFKCHFFFKKGKKSIAKDNSFSIMRLTDTVEPTRLCSEISKTSSLKKPFEIKMKKYLTLHFKSLECTSASRKALQQPRSNAL